MHGYLLSNKKTQHNYITTKSLYNTSFLLFLHSPQQFDEGTSLEHLTDGPSPLGLRLRKSSSLVNLIQMELAQAAKRKREDTESATDTSTSDTKSIAKQITKASNFQASLLKIGAWEVILSPLVSSKVYEILKCCMHFHINKSYNFSCNMWILHFFN